ASDSLPDLCVFFRSVEDAAKDVVVARLGKSEVFQQKYRALGPQLRCGDRGSKRVTEPGDLRIGERRGRNEGWHRRGVRRRDDLYLCGKCGIEMLQQIVHVAVERADVDAALRERLDHAAGVDEVADDRAVQLRRRSLAMSVQQPAERDATRHRI